MPEPSSRAFGQGSLEFERARFSTRMKIYPQSLKILLLKGLVVTLPLGGWSPFPIPYTSLTFLFLYAYLALAFATFGKSFSRKLFKQYAWPLLALWLIMLVMTRVHQYAEVEGANSILRQFLFFSVFFMFALKDVEAMTQKGESLYPYYLIAVVGIILAFFGGFSIESGSEGRQSLVGLNPNNVAMYAAGAVLILLDSLWNKKGVAANDWVKKIAVVSLIALTVIIAATGSRGGILILAVSLVVYFGTLKRLTARALGILFPMVAVSFGGLWFIISSDVMVERLATMDADIRITTLWPPAMDIVRQHPIFGAGLEMYAAELLAITGRQVAPHNEYLKIATGAGLIGLALFSLVLIRLSKNALSWRQATGSGLQLALLSMVVLFLGKGGGALQSPFVWVFFLMLATPVFKIGGSPSWHPPGGALPWRYPA